MASSSQVHTVHDNAKSDGHQPSQGNDRFADKGPGNPLDPFVLPPAQNPPAEVPRLSSNEQWKKEHPNPSEEDKILRQKDYDNYRIWLNYKKERNEVEEKGSKPRDSRDTIFDDNDYRNKDEAIRDWVDEMALVIRTDADEEKRSAAYRCRS